jgi:hypothetical protein
VCFDPPLCPGESVFCLVFSLVLGFGFVFRWVLGVVWYCSDTGLLERVFEALDGCTVLLGLYPLLV